MLTTLTPLTAKDVHFLQPTKSLKWCERQLKAAREALGSNTVFVKHLAEFWRVEDDVIIQQLKARFN